MNKHEPLGGGWFRISQETVIQVHRTGWRGVWDAVKAAVTGRPRLTVPQKVVCSMLAKPHDHARMPTLEIKQ
jgi:hypothetical protein